MLKIGGIESKMYLYAPNHSINIKYQYEVIRLGKDGRSTVYFDLLIENQSPVPIDTLRVLYPSRFYFAADGRVWTNPSKSQFSDKSTTFIRGDEGIDWTYQLPGSECRLHSAESIPSGTKLRILKLPNPLNPLEDIFFEGLVADENDLIIEDSFTYGHLKILNDMNYTVFTIKLRTPIEEHNRWVRLEFKNESAINLSQVGRYLYFRRMFNVLYYHYNIRGPYEVKMALISYIIAYKNRCYAEKCSDSFLRIIDELLLFFKCDGVIHNNMHISSHTKYENIYITVDPDEMERITDIFSVGDIEIAGFLPNVRILEGSVANLYQWKAINEINKDDISFSIIFQAKPINLLAPLVPWVALILAIIALLLGLFRLFR